MTLAAEDIEFIKAHLGEWLAEQNMGKSFMAYDMNLRERMVRVEEALQHQRELMYEGFKAMDKRFIEMREDMDKRFEGMDKRFEEMQALMDKRFEAVDKRFESMDKRFEAVQADIRTIQSDIKTIQSDIKDLYRALNTQTWKLFGGIGLLAALLKLMEWF
ncbi:MAG: hypothetical protein JXR29_08475 [Methylothermaceae bacterium]|nr:hypothetical protein [Methylothermaceae bacterium]